MDTYRYLWISNKVSLPAFDCSFEQNKWHEVAMHPINSTTARFNERSSDYHILVKNYG
jgi:hypothetical protein